MQATRYGIGTLKIGKFYFLFDNLSVTLLGDFLFDNIPI